MTMFQKGDRVICITEGKAAGKTGTVMEDSRPNYRGVEWTRLKWDRTGSVSAVQCEDFERLED